MHHIILDVETIKAFDQVGGYFPDKLGVSFVGVIERNTLPTTWGQKVAETYHEFFEADLPKLFQLLERVDLVIGFNIDGFDMPALKPYYAGKISRFPTLDLMIKFKEERGHRISLDSIATQTLGTSKSGNGLDAIRYYADGQLRKLADYCMKDVEITRDIYDYGRIHGKVKFKSKWNDVIESPVDFSFTPPPDPGLQMSLV